MRARCKRVGLPVVFAAMAALAGCADAVTVHSIVLEDDPVPDVPVITGTWKRGLPDGQATITFDGAADDVGQCRDGTGHFATGDTKVEGSRVCFVEIDGYLIAEVAAGEAQLGLNRQFLVRFERDRFEVCGEMTIWPLLKFLAEEHPVGYSLASLKHTTREEQYFLLMVFIAEPKEMREFLASALPELASACDSGATSETAWVPYERVSPEESADAEAAGD
jgi:hypothetical protein